MSNKPAFPQTDYTPDWCDAFEREHGSEADKRVLYVWFCAHENAVIDAYRRRCAPVVEWRENSAFWRGLWLGAAITCGGFTTALLLMGAGQ